MSDFIPLYGIGDAVYFRYVPFDFINPQTGELIIQAPEIPAIIASIAHNFSHDIEMDPPAICHECYAQIGWGSFTSFKLTKEEAALLGLDLRYPVGSPLTSDVLRENQITGGRIAF